MKYMALIYSEPGTGPEYGSPEFEPYMGGYFAMNAKCVEDGVMVAGEALEAADTSTTVRVRDGKVETMDGPFAETKEVLGGFYLLDCDNLDDAIKYAAMVPTATHGCVEIRPVMEIPGRE